MSDAVDLDLLTLYRRAGQDQSSPPGLLIASKPRRPARSREGDRLIIHLELTGNVTLPLELPEQILKELEKTYYETNGSVTAALRFTTEALNQILLKRNLQSAGGNQVVGLLTLVSLRGDQLFISQSGPVYACYLNADQVEELYDPQLSGRGLGINQTAALRYYHASLKPGDTLVFSSRLVGVWSPQMMGGMASQGLEFQRQRLLYEVNDLNGFLLGVKPGSGEINQLSARPLQMGPAVAQPNVEELEKESLQTEQDSGSKSPNVLPLEDEIDTSVQEQALLDQYQPLPELNGPALNGLSMAPEVVSVSPVPGASVAAPPASTTSEAQKPGSRVEASRPAKPGLLKRLAGGILAGLNWLLPAKAFEGIPNSVLAFIALATPLVIVAVAMAVYFQRGVAAQSEAIYSQAVQAVQQAQSLVDPAQRREAFYVALRYLDAADAYRQLPQTGALRLQVQGALDELDLIKRLNYQPAIVSGLPDGARISRVVAVDRDLFLLDLQNGLVLRAFFTSQGYQIDPTFNCGPGSPTTIGPIVDLNPWTVSNSEGISVVGMDAQGKLIYCGATSGGRVQTLASPPDRVFSNLKGFALDQTDLYVLDPSSDAVWVYWNGDFEGEPVYYFSEQVPPLEDVIDLTATNEELYLLHQDGHMTICQTGSLGVSTPNRCTDPVPYVDMRTGREGSAVTAPPAYSQVETNPPPDPSLYLLDGNNQAIDRFSLRNLAFQNRFQPVQPLSQGPATAFTIDSVNRMAYLAIGSRVYYASLP